MTCWITEKERYEGKDQMLLVNQYLDYVLSLCSDLMAPVLHFMTFVILSEGWFLLAIYW